MIQELYSKATPYSLLTIGSATTAQPETVRSAAAHGPASKQRRKHLYTHIYLQGFSLGKVYNPASQ